MAKSSLIEADIDWNGPEVQSNVLEACRRGVNITMQRFVEHAKLNHPNWQNRTGNAEGSVRIISAAQVSGMNVVGVCGSSGVNYAQYLEADHGPWLREAADVVTPGLAGHVKAQYRRLAA